MNTQENGRRIQNMEKGFRNGQDRMMSGKEMNMKER